MARNAGVMAPLRIAAVSGFPPDPQGEANYAGLAFGPMATEYRDELALRVFAHVHVTEPAYRRLQDNLDVVRVTGHGSRSARARAVRVLGPQILEWKPDICHLEGTHTPLYGGLYGEPTVELLRRLHKAGIPTLMTLHSTWFLADLEDLWRSKGLRGPLVAAAVQHYSWYLRRLVRGATITRVATTGLGGSTLARFASDHRLPLDRLHVEAHPCATAHMASPEQRREAREELGLDGDRIVLAVGYVRADKNLASLIAAAPAVFSADPHAQIVIAGEPVGADGHAYGAELLRLAAQSEWSARIHVRLGFQAPEVFERLVDAADIVVVPYARSIGPSGPIHHALGRGLAVVATNIGHNTPLGDAIALYDPSDPDALGAALAKLLRTPAELAGLHLRAVDYAREHSWSALRASYVQHYRDLSGRTAHGSDDSRHP